MKIETVIHPEIGDIYIKVHPRTDERTTLVYVGKDNRGLFHFHKLDNVISHKVIADYEDEIEQYNQSRINVEYENEKLLFVCNVDKNGMSNAMANVIDYYKRYKGLEE